MTKTKYIGYSNGKTYDVIDIDKTDKTIGLVEIEGYVLAQWCTFERIEKRKA